MTRAALFALCAGTLLAACGDDLPADPTPTPDARPDAATPDARIDAGLPDATVDAGVDAVPPDATTDRDGDRIDDELDCAPDDIARWRIVPTYADGDRDGRGAGDPVDSCVGAVGPDGRTDVAGDCDDGNGAIYQLLAYSHRDADGDGRFIAEASTVCSGAALPAGHRATDPGTEPDCAPADPLAFALRTAYVDADRDGFGVEPSLELCVGAALPAGHAAVAGDCAADDAARWQLLAYSHRDSDGDGATTPENGSVCSGAALPAGYRTTASGADCAADDATRWQTVTLYADTDGDLIGAGPAIPTCMGTTRPAGMSDRGTDCAADDVTRWGMLPYSHVDRDRDGATLPEAGTVCSGAAVLPPFFIAPIGHDCDDADDARHRWVVLYPDRDHDGVGETPYDVVCLGADIPEGRSTRGYDIDDSDPTVIEDEEEDDELLDLILF
jgi:hypothetical protein